MSVIIEDIQGYVSGKVHYFFATDCISADLQCAQIVTDLIKKWFTDTLCICLDNRGEIVTKLLSDAEKVANAYIINQRKFDCDKVIERALKYIRRYSVGAIVICRADKLFKNNEPSSTMRKLEMLAEQQHMPVILIECYEIIIKIPTRTGFVLFDRAGIHFPPE